MESVKENGRLWRVDCREGGRELGHGVELSPPGAHPARLRAPLAMLIQPCDHLPSVRAVAHAVLHPYFNGLIAFA